MPSFGMLLFGLVVGLVPSFPCNSRTRDDTPLHVHSLVQKQIQQNSLLFPTMLNKTLAVVLQKACPWRAAGPRLLHSLPPGWERSPCQRQGFFWMGGR